MSKPTNMVVSSNSPQNVVRIGARRQTLEAWIAEALEDDEKRGPSGEHPWPCRQITLVHMQGPTASREIHPALVEGKSAKILSQIFEGKAQSYAQDLPGVQTFNLLAFYGTTHEAQAFHPFTITGEAFHPGLATESPDATGILQQLMRHLEIKEKLHVQERVTVFDTLMQTIDFLSKGYARLQEENAEAFAIMKEIMLEKSLNSHDQKMKELAFIRGTGDRDKIMKVAPALINQIAGREVFPQSTADTAILEALVDNVEPEMLEMFLASGKIPVEAAGLLKARFTEIAESKVKNQERLALLAKQSRVATGDPEAEAAGDVTP